MALPAAFSSFPSLDTYPAINYRFNRPDDLGLFDYLCGPTGDGFVGGHDAPTVANAATSSFPFGSVTLGSGSTASGAFVQMQEDCLWTLSSRTNKLYEWLFQVQLSSATLTLACVGVAPAITAATGAMAGNITSGFGAYANLVGGASATNWTFFVCNGATSQLAPSASFVGPACDTSVHTMGIYYLTDPSTLGAGQMYFTWDGVQQGNGYSSSSSAIFPSSTAMGMFAAGGNGSAAAQTLIVGEMAMFGRR